MLTADIVPVKRSPLIYGNDSMNLDIILTNLDCRGTESSLLGCQMNNRAVRHCDHSEDAGVRCGGMVVLYYADHVVMWLCLIGCSCVYGQ